MLLRSVTAAALGLFCIALAEGPAVGVSPAAKHLEPLNFLIGKWRAEDTGADGEKTVRTISYKWMFDKQFLVAESSRKTGDTTLAMHITYLWDAKQRQLRAWVVSSDGAWNQSIVCLGPKSATLKAQGALGSGQSITGTSALKSTGPDTRTEQWEDMTIDGHDVPVPPVVHWKRVP